MKHSWNPSKVRLESSLLCCFMLISRMMVDSSSREIMEFSIWWSLSIFITSANSLPGDVFYPVKTFVENIQYKLTFNPNSKQALLNEIQEKRKEEIELLFINKRSSQVHFVGRLIKIENDTWFVDQFRVLISPNTKIFGTPEIGKLIQIWGITSPNGTIEAIKIQTESGTGGSPKNSPSPMPTSTNMMEIMGGSSTPTPTIASTEFLSSTNTPYPSRTPTLPPATNTMCSTNTPSMISPPLPTTWITYLPGSTQTPLPTYIATYIINPTHTPRPTRILPTEYATYIPPDASTPTPIMPQSTPVPPQVFIITRTPTP